MLLKSHYILVLIASTAYGPIVKAYEDERIGSLWIITSNDDELTDMYKKWNKIRDNLPSYVIFWPIKKLTS